MLGQVGPSSTGLSAARRPLQHLVTWSAGQVYMSRCDTLTCALLECCQFSRISWRACGSKNMHGAPDALGLAPAAAQCVAVGHGGRVHLPVPVLCAVPGAAA